MFLSDKELLTSALKTLQAENTHPTSNPQDYIDSINDIMENEFVVHTIHGIGIFKGLRKEEMDGALKDYLEIEFQGGDKLLCPQSRLTFYTDTEAEAAQNRTKLKRWAELLWENTEKQRQKK